MLDGHQDQKAQDNAKALQAGRDAINTEVTINAVHHVNHLIGERITAFKIIRDQLVSLQLYLEAKAGDQTGRDFAPRSESLPDEHKGSALLHRERLRAVCMKHMIFLPLESNALIDSLDRTLAHLCRCELHTALCEIRGHPHDLWPYTDQFAIYDDAASKVKLTMQELFNQLTLN